MKLYAYCLTENPDDLTISLSGISNAKVRLLRIEDLGVLVSDSEMDAVPVTRENALTHAAVLGSVLDRTTPLPFRFGTLLTEPQLINYITARKPALKAKLAHVRGCVEMNVKIIQQLPKEDEAQTEDVDSQQGPGTAFLAQKRRELLGDEHRSTYAAGLSALVRETLDGMIKDEQVALRPSERLVLAAAHLVEHSNIQEYRQKIADTVQAHPELHFLVSGPWPPYSFANIELEFPTHFGVT
jgi:hypothetical protein